MSTLRKRVHLRDVPWLVRRALWRNLFVLLVAYAIVVLVAAPHIVSQVTCNDVVLDARGVVNSIRVLVRDEGP